MLHNKSSATFRRRLGITATLSPNALIGWKDWPFVTFREYPFLMDPLAAYASLGRFFFLRFLERRWFSVSRQAYEKVEPGSRTMASGRCCSPGFRSWAIRSRS